MKTRRYPTLEEVKTANRTQLARWRRFLPSPGWDAVGKPEFEETMYAEAAVMDRICERFDELGGMTPGMSKHIDAAEEGRPR